MGAKKSGGSPKVKQRADWNPALERSLVDILHEYKDGYRGDNGWSSEGWNKIVKEFHARNRYVSYTKVQIQEKEGQLKRDYKMLKAAKQHRGSRWNEKRNMVEGSPAMWANLMVTFPKIKKFNSNKATFPLFDALGELYDGHLAKVTYNFTSLEAMQEEEYPEQLHDVEDEPQGLHLPSLQYMPTTSATKKKPSPKCNGAKKSGGSPKVKQRADWNPALERSLVDILYECKDGYRGDKGWSSEGWNKIVKEFHVRNRYVSYTRVQIQEKEGQLKRDYKMLKAAKQHRGSRWIEKRNMVEGSPAMWANLMATFPKIKKFNNNKATFPLFDVLGELYDGHLAKGTYNFTSLEAPQEEEPHDQLHDAEDEPLGFDDNVVHEVNDEVDDTITERNNEVLQGRVDTLSRDEESEAPAIERSGQRRPAVSRNREEKELKKPRMSENIESMMGRYLEMMTKQAEDEAAREKVATKCDDFSIKRCISVLNTVEEVTKLEKAKAYSIFMKSKENRETFICAFEADQESALIWLRNEMS
ncbi:unnamed protein product [Urochloa humidicola]